VVLDRITQGYGARGAGATTPGKHG